ncbi:hypothetical protein ACJX0J_023841 [Zea mays]
MPYMLLHKIIMLWNMTMFLLMLSYALNSSVTQCCSIWCLLSLNATTFPMNLELRLEIYLITCLHNLTYPILCIMAIMLIHVPTISLKSYFDQHEGLGNLKIHLKTCILVKMNLNENESIFYKILLHFFFLDCPF